MALFKILRGNSSKLFDAKGNISSTVPFNDGYCYFTPDNKKFYIDWLDESGGQHRDPLNSLSADKAAKVNEGLTAGGKTFDGSAAVTINATDVGALPLSGGTLTGNLTGKYITGTWLQSTANNHLDRKPPKVCVQDASGWVYHRTAEELRDDIGAAPASHTSDTTAHITSSERTTWNAKASPPTITTVTLTAANWDSAAKTQTATATGILADETKQLIQVMPAPASMTAVTAAGAYCSSQGADSLTFTCSTVPTEDIVFNISFQDANYV